MQNNRYLPLIVLFIAAILVFGAFVVLNLTQSPETIQETTPESTEASGGQATDEPSTEVTPESTEAGSDETSEETSPESTEAAASGETSSGAPTPTSMSRVRGSILIGTQVTPVLQPETQSQESQPADGNPTPTSMSRVPNSILIGTPVAPSPDQPQNDEQNNQIPEGTSEPTAETTPESTEEALAPPSVSSSASNAPFVQNPPSILQPQGPVAEWQAMLWWLMLALSSVIYVFVLALVFFVLRRRNKDTDEITPRESRWLIFGGGIALPLVVITLLFLLTLSTMAVLAIANKPTELTVEVTGKQWWWEIRYPDHDVITANEIHIPVGVPVKFVLKSDNVIHSFWVPELGGKMDLIPGRVNQFWLQADKAGLYRGQCAEFCGIQHAKMAFLVIADEQAAFNQWVEQRQQPAAQPQGELAARGQEVFLNSECISCHTIRGTDAAGVLGPDLTHLASRRTLAAGTLTNTTDHLADWIVNSQSIKPGNKMPSMAVENLDALLAYLTGLK